MKNFIEQCFFRPDSFSHEALGIQRPDEDDLHHRNPADSDSKRQALSKFFYIRTFIRSFESIKNAGQIPKRFADIILDTCIRLVDETTKPTVHLVILDDDCKKVFVSQSLIRISIISFWKFK